MQMTENNFIQFIILIKFTQSISSNVALNIHMLHNSGCAKKLQKSNFAKLRTNTFAKFSIFAMVI